MKIFIDTADVDQIARATSWGVIDGVTTNPTHVAKTGRRPADVYKEICDLVDGPISLETIGLEVEEILDEGRELAQLHPNVVVKVVNTKAGLQAVKQLNAEGIRTNVTVTFSPLQALLAAKCGASYISPFVGRLDAVGHDGMELNRQIREIYQNYGYKTEIIVAAVRHPLHVLQAALVGSDICTMAYGVIEQLYQHPLTDLGIEQFLKDWKSVPQS